MALAGETRQTLVSLWQRIWSIAWFNLVWRFVMKALIIGIGGCIGFAVDLLGGGLLLSIGVCLIAAGFVLIK